MAFKFQVIFWRDIPAQIKIRTTDRQRLSKPLPERFSVAIDEAAMRAGLTSSEDYLAQWRSGEWQQQVGDPAEAADALVAQLNTDYPPARVRKLIQQHGLEEIEE